MGLQRRYGRDDFVGVGADDVMRHDVLQQLETKEPLGEVTALQSQTGTTYTLVLSDKGKTYEGNNASAITLTIPPNADVPLPVKSYVNVVQMGAGQITITAGSGVTLRSRNGLKLGGQYAMATLYKRDTDEWVVGGDLTS